MIGKPIGEILAFSRPQTTRGSNGISSPTSIKASDNVKRRTLGK